MISSFIARLKLWYLWTLEVISVISYIWLFIVGNFMGIPVVLYLLTTPLFFLPILYFIWMYIDYDTPFRGGRPGISRHMFTWKYIASYFPIKLHKTADLDPTKNYMFCFHPHGILGYSCLVNFASEATEVSKKFPGLTIHPLTLDINFAFPLYREHVMACGIGSVRKDSINYKLTKLGEGHSVVIVTGGAAEARLSDPDNPYRLTIKGRKGFVREALKAGAALVPVFSFGESEIYRLYEPKPGSLMDRIQKFNHRFFRFIPLVFYGKYGLMPYRRPINTVVGSALPLPRIEKPTPEDLEMWHAKYIEALKDLFDRYKGEFGTPNKELEFV